ncbi:MAG: class I SAM-dependent methyltransferase [Candidatus Moraniibacteriota bacterium]
MEKLTSTNELKKDSSISFFDKHGKEYVENQRKFYSQAPDTGREFFRDSLRADIEKMTIADIGCGAGDDLITYRELGAKKVIGIEPSLSMLSEAKKTLGENYPDIELVAGNWKHLPLADDSMDAIMGRYSFHVMSDFDEAILEVARVLKKDGLFLIAAPHPDHDAKIAAEQNLKLGEKMRIPIFEGKFIVENPPHTLKDYLSKTCLENFILEEQKDYSMFEDENETDPTGILLKLRRKN